MIEIGQSLRMQFKTLGIENKISRFSVQSNLRREITQQGYTFHPMMAAQTVDERSPDSTLSRKN